MSFIFRVAYDNTHTQMQTHPHTHTHTHRHAHTHTSRLSRGCSRPVHHLELPDNDDKKKY